jgi:chaperone modulatory protein CbpM
MTFETEVMWLDEHRAITLAELIEVSGLTERELLELVHAGVIPTREARGPQYTFSAQVVTVARTACRLRDDLELDVHGVGVALRLLDRVSDLESEVARLRAQLPRS